MISSAVRLSRMRHSLYLSVFTSLLVVCLGAQAGGDHKHGPGCNHDHEAKPPESENLFTVSEEARAGLGIEVAVIEMRAIADDGDSVIAIPRSCVVTENGKTFVYAQSESDESKFERWKVQLGAGDDRFVEATSGVFPGDSLVVSGAQFMPALEGANSMAFEKDAVLEDIPPAPPAFSKRDSVGEDDTSTAAPNTAESECPSCPPSSVRSDWQLSKGTRCDREGDCPNPITRRSVCGINRCEYNAIYSRCSQEWEVRVIFVPGYGYVTEVAYPY